LLCKEIRCKCSPVLTLGRFAVVQACFRVPERFQSCSPPPCLRYQVVLTYMFAQRTAAASAYNNIQGKVFLLFDKLQYSSTPLSCRLQNWARAPKMVSEALLGVEKSRRSSVRRHPRKSVEGQGCANRCRCSPPCGTARRGKRKREFVDAAARRCHGALVLFFGGTPDCW
jgi:hypothetical protein